MNIRIVTASAGTGKTTHLARLLDQAISDASARPGAILATTFTKQAAAELINRARTQLLRSGHGAEAQALLTARIGTVNAVCGSLVTDFSFELGLSPELRVLDEAGAELALKRALASVVTEEISDRLQGFMDKFDRQWDWHYEVRRLIEAARANGLDEVRIAESAERSVASLDACLGPVVGTAEELDGDLRTSIDTVLRAIDASGDTSVGTKKYRATLVESRRDLDADRLRWGGWAKLSSGKLTKTTLQHAGSVQAAASRHIGHPRLRQELHELVRLMFDVAGRGLRAYQEFKRDQGLLDFVDQEVHALDLLSLPEIRALLQGEVDLVLVDEFQDTSPLQLVIFLELARLAKQSVWVGDPKQAIYGFRGTDPKLMDAAIESLTSASQDPELVATAVRAVTQQEPVETLSRSYRSRPELVELTNAIFARAFAAQQDMPEERVIVAAHREESGELGPAVSHWRLEGSTNASARAAALAAGVRDLLATQPNIWDRDANAHRNARAGDLGILCRTNAQCLEVSEALGQLGIAAVVARVGLRDTAEAQILLAGLGLWVDERDRLAAAILARIVEYPEDAGAFVEAVVAPEGEPGVTAAPVVRRLLAARGLAGDLGVVAAVDAVIDAVRLRELCAGWGEPVQRTANLDALRAHASRYVEECRSAGAVGSVVGFLAWFDELASEWGWTSSRSDTIARVGSEDAVTVSTWHAAKGLEWPIVVLFGLESVRDPQAYGVHVLTDRETFDVSDPLGGRWIHFWPNPYTTSNQNGPVKDAYAASDAYRHVASQVKREVLRVLYVGWTRARDRLILAAQDKKLLGGLLRMLAEIDPKLIEDPGAGVGVVEATWAGHRFGLAVDAARPAEPVAAAAVPGTVRVGREPGAYAGAMLAPSSAPPRSAELREPVRLGAAVKLGGAVEVEAVGNAVHAFFAADDPARERGARVAVASGLLERHRVGAVVQAETLVEFADRLWAWVTGAFGADAVVRPEWPVGVRWESGTQVLGVADLVIETGDGVAVVDHKSLGLAAAAKRVGELAGQLGCYADAVARAVPGKRVSMWVHLPFEGVVVEVG